ncbi:MAG TPA: SanA protein, partial [Ruminococcaceae bacterium]|nr:SanA protein [Oscillospiraceae bacterium]
MRKIKKYAFALVIFAAVCAVLALSLNFHIVKSTEKSIFTEDALGDTSEADCILILGAGVKNGKPTPMLRDRLLTGIKLYKNGKAAKIIMSGDHGSAAYDEVNVMRLFAAERGVKEEDIFTDHAGFST